jgi:hypothetical protein
MPSNNHRPQCSTHCCLRHGCKYGYSDCPVVNGQVKQEYPCGDCLPVDEAAKDVAAALAEWQWSLKIRGNSA